MTANLPSIYHWHRLDHRVTTSGQPTEAQLADITALGVRCVINLGLHSHERALRDEAASVEALGMAYVHIPVDFQAPSESDFAAFCSALDATKDVALHVHCIANYRVSAFFYRYRRSVLGWSEIDARADLHQIWQPDEVWTAFIAQAVPAAAIR